MYQSGNPAQLRPDKLGGCSTRPTPTRAKDFHLTTTEGNTLAVFVATPDV